MSYLLEKVATRSWKKNLEFLGKASKQKLLSSGILNHEKEIEGLNKGTTNLISRYKGAAFDWNKAGEKKEVVKHLVTDAKDSPVFKAIGQKIERPTSMIKGLGDVAGGFLTSYRKNRSVALGDIKKGGLGSIFDLPKSEVGTRAVNSVMNRHEADELRHGIQQMISKKKSIAVGNHGKIPAGSMLSHGHLSPQVLGRESANLAVMPTDAKKFMKKIRNVNTGMVGVPNEATVMNTLSKHNYGEKGVYDKKHFSKLYNHIKDENKKTIESIT